MDRVASTIAQRGLNFKLREGSSAETSGNIFLFLTSEADPLILDRSWACPTLPDFKTVTILYLMSSRPLLHGVTKKVMLEGHSMSLHPSVELMFSF